MPRFFYVVFQTRHLCKDTSHIYHCRLSSGVNQSQCCIMATFWRICSNCISYGKVACIYYISFKIYGVIFSYILSFRVFILKAMIMSYNFYNIALGKNYHTFELKHFMLIQRCHVKMFLDHMLIRMRVKKK